MCLSYSDLACFLKEQKVLPDLDLKEIFKNPDDILKFFYELFSSDFDYKKVFSENFDLFCEIASPLKQLRDVPQNNPYHYADVFNHTIDAICICESKNWYVKLALLFHDIGKKSTRQTIDGTDHFYGHAKVGKSIIESWGIIFSDSSVINNIIFLVEVHNNVIPLTKSSVKKLRNKFDSLDVTIYDWIDMKRADILAHSVSDDLLFKLKIMEDLLDDLNSEEIMDSIKSLLPINGADIENLGFKGEVIGKIKKDCLDYFIMNRCLISREDLLSYIESKYID